MQHKSFQIIQRLSSFAICLTIFSKFIFGPVLAAPNHLSSDLLSLLEQAGPAAALTPPVVTASDGTDTAGVKVSWTASSGATSYLAYRSDSPTGAKIPTNGYYAASLGGDDVWAVPGVTYYYWVKACDASSCSDFSAAETGWRGLIPPIVTASDGTDASRVNVSWTASSGATSYIAYRSDSLAGTKLPPGGYPITGLGGADLWATPGVTYYYWVKACNGSNCSDFSAYDTGWRYSGQGQSYYVAPTGNDLNPGTLDQPWQTIQRAADTLTAGEMVYIRAGIYRERVIPKNSGSPGSEITYEAFPGETATIDGSGLSLPNDLAGLFEIAGKSYIRVSGLRLVNVGPFANNAAILVSDSSYVTIQNSKTFNTLSSGIGVWGSQQVVIDGNTVELAGHGGYQECITVAGTSNFEVRNNTVIDCQKEGIDAKDGSSNGLIYRNIVNRPRAVGIYVDAWDKATHDIRVFQNAALNSIESSGFTVASEQGGLLSRIWLENNVAYHNHTYGIEISHCCSASHPMDTIIIINNTLYENGVGWGGGIIVDNAQAQGVIVRNNLSSQNLTFQIAVAADVPKANVAVDHNLINGYRGYEDEVYGDNYVEGDPQFEAPAIGNFHLRPGSPAVDTGSATEAPYVDFDGDFRPQDGDGNGTSQYDIGADELAPHS